MDQSVNAQPVAFDLSQAEVLALMLAVDTSLIVGIDNDKLVPDGRDVQGRMANAGIDLLRSKGWLTRSEENPEVELLEGNLGMMAPALAYPEAMFIVTHDEPGRPQQQFRYYRANPVHLALELPAENKYRLVAIQDAITMLNEMRANLPITIEPKIAIDSFSMPFEQFMAAKRAAEDRNIVSATTQFTGAGCSTPGAEALAHALLRPTFGGSIAFLRLENQEVVDGRNLVVVQDDTAGWMIQPREDNPELLQIQTATPADYSQVLLANTRAVI